MGPLCIRGVAVVMVVLMVVVGRLSSGGIGVVLVWQWRVGCRAVEAAMGHVLHKGCRNRGARAVGL